MKRELVVRQVLSVAQQVGEIVSGLNVQADLRRSVHLDGKPGPDVEDGPARSIGPDAEARDHAESVSHRRALWNLHDAVMAGEAPADCPDCGADEWSPSAEAFETTGRIVCEDCADTCMEQHNG